MKNERIINDVLELNKKTVGGYDSRFDEIVVAVNDMYRYLYNAHILEKVCFEYKAYDEEVYFALDTAKLIPYKDEMLTSNIKNAALAVDQIFDVPHTSCLYCGSITLTYNMSTYRDNCGTIGRSCECTVCQSFKHDVLSRVLGVKKIHGVQSAVKELWTHIQWVD